MKVETDNAAIELDSNQLLRLQGAAGVRVVCRSGIVWVTQEGVLRDDFLSPGNSLTLESSGMTLMQATQRALLSIDTGPRRTRVVIASLIAPAPSSC